MVVVCITRLTCPCEGTIANSLMNANICSKNLVHFVLSGATASYAVFIGVFSKNSGLKSLKGG